MISGHATHHGTRRFADNSGINPYNFNEFCDLVLSNVGIGTYLGNPDAQTDNAVKDAVKQSILSGVNVVDTAINYRSQKAERSIGRALSELVQAGKISRDQIFLSSKNGYLTNDADVNLGLWEYVKEEYTQKGVLKEGDVTSGYHCMTRNFLSDQLERTLKNLDIECLDLLYLHNAVEGQIKDRTQEEFLANLESVFALYEEKRAQDKIRFYGMATWECFRVPDTDVQYLSLEDTVNMAKRVGGQDHGFRFIQLPFNLHYDQALLAKNQLLDSQKVSILEAATKLGIGVFTSVPFMQGRLLQPDAMPDFHNELLPSLRALQFIRSTPGVLAPLVGQKTAEHVGENLKIMNVPPIPHDEFVALVKKLTSG